MTEQLICGCKGKCVGHSDSEAAQEICGNEDCDSNHVCFKPKGHKDGCFPPAPSPAATTGQETCGCHVNHGKVPCCPCKCHIVPPIATTQPKPAPQAAGFEEWFTDERADKYQYGAEGAARDAWSAAQAPLLARIAELEERLSRRFHQLADMTTRAELAEARIAELENRGTASLYVPKAQYEAMKARLEVRIAELEYAQPKAEPVERLVSDETLKSFSTNFGVVSKIATELLQRRQREERRER